MLFRKPPSRFSNDAPSVILYFSAKCADPSQIKRAYRDAIKRHHPEMIGSLNARKFIVAHEAYEVLSDINKRRAYDAELSRQDILIRKKNPKKKPLNGLPLGKLSGACLR